MKFLLQFVLAVISALALLTIAAESQRQERQEPRERPTRTKWYFLAPVPPLPDPDRSGPATAIIVDNSAYLVDFGPGVVRRAKAAVLDRGVKALEPTNLR